MPNCFKKLFVWLWYSLASLIILFAVVGSLVKALTPVLNDHIPALEKTLEKYLHQEVTIGSVDVNWATFGPEFHFNDVTIYNEQKVLIKADELMAHIGIWRSLYKRSIFLRSFTLDGVDLDVVEVTKHKYSINGFGNFDIDATDDNNPLIAWLSWQRHMQLNNIHLHYTPIGNGTTNIELRQQVGS